MHRCNVFTETGLEEKSSIGVQRGGAVFIRSPGKPDGSGCKTGVKLAENMGGKIGSDWGEKNRIRGLSDFRGKDGKKMVLGGIIFKAVQGKSGAHGERGGKKKEKAMTPRTEERKHLQIKGKGRGCRKTLSRSGGLCPISPK